MIHSTGRVAVWNFRWDDCRCPWGSVTTTPVVLWQAAETWWLLIGAAKQIKDQAKLCSEWRWLFCCLFLRVPMCRCGGVVTLLSELDLSLAANNQWEQATWTKQRGCNFKQTEVGTLIPHTWAIPVRITVHNHTSGHTQELEKSSGIYPNVTYLFGTSDGG